VELPVGKYLLKEKAAPTGFVLTDKTIEVEISHESADVIEIEVDNAPTEVVIEKTDVTTSEALPGAAIEVYDESGMVVFAGVTNNDGSIIIHELPVGTYTWKEIVAPLGYTVNVAEFTFAIDEYGVVTGDTEITDEPTALTVKKINSYNNTPMPGVEFTLTDAEGKPVNITKTDEGWYIPGGNSATFAVGEDGTAEIRYLPVGDYTLTEHTPAGFISKGTFELSITDENGTENPCGVVVYNEPTVFKLYKVHAETEKPLTGAGFTFKTRAFIGYNTLTFTKLENGWYMYDTQGDVTEIMVDAKGEIAILGLPLGTEIFIEETTVPEGFFPNPAQKIMLTADNAAELPLEVTIKNAPGVKLGIDSDKYNVLIAIGVTLLGVGVIVWRVVAAKRALKKDEKEAKK